MESSENFNVKNVKIRPEGWESLGKSQIIQIFEFQIRKINKQSHLLEDLGEWMLEKML